MSPRQCLEGVRCCVVPELCLSAVSFNQRLPGQPIVTPTRATCHVTRGQGPRCTRGTAARLHMLCMHRMKALTPHIVLLVKERYEGGGLLCGSVTLVSEYVRAMKER